MAFTLGDRVNDSSLHWFLPCSNSVLPLVLCQCKEFRDLMWIKELLEKDNKLTGSLYCTASQTFVLIVEMWERHEIPPLLENLPWNHYVEEVIHTQSSPRVRKVTWFWYVRYSVNFAFTKSCRFPLSFHWSSTEAIKYLISKLFIRTYSLNSKRFCLFCFLQSTENFLLL